MVRKFIGPLLIGLGAFSLVAAIIAVSWAPDVAKRTPLDTDTVTRLAGHAEKLNPATGEVESMDVRATSFTRADSKRSDDDVIVFTNTTCVVRDLPDTPDCGINTEDKDNPDPNIITISTDGFAADRRTGVAVNDLKHLPPSTIAHEGLVNKFPFDTQRKTYPYWEGLLLRTVDAKFDGTEKIHGLETYRFVVNIDREFSYVVPGTRGYYTMDRTMWVEPVTGAIVKQEQHEVRTMENGDPILDLKLAFTPEQTKSDVQFAKDNVARLNLIDTVIPWVGFIVGPLLLVAGVFLILINRRGRRTSDA